MPVEARQAEGNPPDAVFDSGAEDWHERGLAANPNLSASSTAHDAALYTAGFYASQVLVFVAGLVQKGILGPRGAGFWALMGTFWSLLGLLALGTFSGAAREVPAARGRGDFVAAGDLADTAVSFGTAAFGIAGIAVSGAALLIGDSWAPEMQYGLVLVGLTAPIRFVADYHIELFRALRRFRVLALSLVLNGWIVLVVQTAFVVWLGFYGMFAGAIALALGSLLFWSRLRLTWPSQKPFRWRIDKSRVRRLVSVGLPIAFYGQIWILFVGIDSLLVAGFLSVTDLGYYALAVSVNQYVLFLPRAVGGAVFPRMQERFARNGEVAAIRHYATDIPRVLGFTFVPLFLATVFFFLPVVIRHALPAFEPGIDVVQIIVAGSFFLALSNMPAEFLITAGFRWRLTALMAVLLAVGAGEVLIAIAVLGWGVEGAALATSLSFLTYFVAVTWYGVGKASSPHAVRRQLAVLGLAGAHMIVALWLVGTVLPSSAALSADMGLSIAKFIAFIVLFSPWLIAAERRYGLIAMLRSVLRRGEAGNR